MKKEKALEILSDLTVDYENRTPDEIAELDEALDMAITALKTQEDDNISIHTVIDAINGMPTFVDRNGEKLIHQGLTKIKIKALASTTGHTDESSLVKSDTNDEDRTEDDQISRRAAIHTVHKIILGFFSGADDMMTDAEKTLLSVNKAVCNGVRALPPSPSRPKGQWLINTNGYYPYCSECNTEPKSGDMTDFCPSCGADMRGKQDG